MHSCRSSHPLHFWSLVLVSLEQQFFLVVLPIPRDGALSELPFRSSPHFDFTLCLWQNPDEHRVPSRVLAHVTDSRLQSVLHGLIR